MNRLQVNAWAAPWRDGIALRFLYRDENGNRFYGKSIELVPAAPPGVSADETCVIETHDAQRLMDDLWNAGLRPTEGAGSAGSLRATEKHLQDMRQLVFGEKLKP